MKKLTALILALALSLTFVSALAENTFTTIEAGKLTYATSPDFPPFENRYDNDNVVGIEPDIMALIGEKLGVTVEAVPMDFTSALLSAQLGKTDLVVSGVTATGEKAEERKIWFDFTDIYTSIQQAIVFKSGKDISMENLGQQTIGVQAGTTGQDLTEDDFGEEHVVAYDTYSLAFQALQNGQVDCILVDDLVGQAYVKRIPGLEIVTTTYEPEEFGFGFAKDKYPELLEAFNKVLQELIDDGTVESIILKWNE
jgi:polar amino acid transport system substrate-binding protein